MKIVLQNLTKKFPDRNKKAQGGVTAVSDFSYEIPDGKLVSLLGPSGCGKSTTLNLICGLEKPDGGKVLFGEQDVTGLPPEKRGVGMVFQNYALYPHLTVRKNILFPMENLKGKDRLSKEEMNRRADEAAKLVQITELMDRKPGELSGGQQQRVAIARALVKTPNVLLLDEPLSNLDARLRITELMDRKPGELSGGQQQRVAIARALVKTPNVLLLDEPLSNLDARLRLQTREEIRRIQRETKLTTVFVTHDQDEALSISDMIVVMKDGILQQTGKPQEVYDSPANLFVAKFLGTPPINLFAGKVCGGKLMIGDDGILQQTGKPQEVYDSPANLFVAKFLGTPPINLFAGKVCGGKLMIGDEAVLDVSGAEDREVTVGIRPEGFILKENGALKCGLSGIEVLGRDISVVAVLDVSGAEDREVTVGIRPEGFILKENGALKCGLSGIEVLGRDISVVCSHPACSESVIRAIIDSDNLVDTRSQTVCFELKPEKVFLFDTETGERIFAACGHKEAGCAAERRL